MKILPDTVKPSHCDTWIRFDFIFTGGGGGGGGDSFLMMFDVVYVLLGKTKEMKKVQQINKI